ncbi:hypothetical protein ACT691_11055 [Vibrio metschnikovii]
MYAQWDAREAGQAKEAAWDEKFAAYAAEYPVEAAEFKRRVNGDLPAQWKSKPMLSLLNYKLTLPTLRHVKPRKMPLKRSVNYYQNLWAALQT